MFPYQPNSDAPAPLPGWPPPLPAEPILPVPLSPDDLVFAPFFFSLLTSVWSRVDFGGLDLGCGDDLVAFVRTVSLGVDLGVGFGVAFDIAFGFAVAFGAGVSTAVG